MDDLKGKLEHSHEEISSKIYGYKLLPFEDKETWFESRSKVETFAGLNGFLYALEKEPETSHDLRTKEGFDAYVLTRRGQKWRQANFTAVQ